MSELGALNLQELLARPREQLDIEIKCWVDLGDDSQRANIAKAIIAIANHGGGFVIVGLAENDSGQFHPDSNPPDCILLLTQDNLQDALQKYLEPAIQCRVHHVDHPDGHGVFPIVVVPGGHRAPIKAKRGSPDGKLVKDRVYIRRPGPKSEEPQTTAEWDELFERCIRARKDELLDGIRDLLSGHATTTTPARKTIIDLLENFIEQAEARWLTRVGELPADAAPRFPEGFYSVAAALEGDYPVQAEYDFMTTIQRAVRNHSGWPPFPIINDHNYRPSLVDGAIEAWFGPDENGKFETPSRCDFWRVTPKGFFFTRRGLDEDGRFKNFEPGTAFDITTPTWRLGEILLQIYYIAVAMGALDASIHIRIVWSGLNGRKLVSIGNPNRLIREDHKAHQDTYEKTVNVQVTALNDALPEIVFEILKPMYMLFDFFHLPKRLVEEELREMRKHEFPY